jgi:hypothetical protein
MSFHTVSAAYRHGPPDGGQICGGAFYEHGPPMAGSEVTLDAPLPTQLDAPLPTQLDAPLPIQLESLPRSMGCGLFILKKKSVVPPSCIC